MIGKEVKKEMKTYRIARMCTECDGGELLPTGMVYACMPPMYEHICNKCEVREEYPRSYPRTSFKEAEDE